MSARQGQLICSMYMLNHLKYTWTSALFNFFRNQNICHLQAFGVTKLVVDCSATFRNQMWTEVYLVLPAFLITFYNFFQEGIPLCDQRLSLAAFSSLDDEAFFYDLHSHVCSVKDGKRTAHVQFPLGFFCEVCITYASVISKSFSHIVYLS